MSTKVGQSTLHLKWVKILSDVTAILQSIYSNKCFENSMDKLIFQDKAWAEFSTLDMGVFLHHTF